MIKYIGKAVKYSPGNELKNKNIVYISNKNTINIIKIIYENQKIKNYEIVQKVTSFNYIDSIVTGENIICILSRLKFSFYTEKNINNYVPIRDLEKKDEKILIIKEKILIFNNKDNYLELKEYDLNLDKNELFNILLKIKNDDTIENINSKIICIYNNYYINFINLNTHQLMNIINFPENVIFSPSFCYNLIHFREGNKIRIAKFDKKKLIFKYIKDLTIDIFDDNYVNRISFIKNNKIFFAGTITSYNIFYVDNSFVSEVKIFDYDI